jgi:GNAT superfamily N-acetyltransferase
MAFDKGARLPRSIAVGLGTDVMASPASGSLQAPLQDEPPSGHRVVPTHGTFSEECAGYRLRSAELADEVSIGDLIARSIRELGRTDYTPEQIEGALESAFGLDRALIRDGTYFVICRERYVVACGGWSRRRTLFGNDRREDREDTWLNPAADPARIRAFFVDPAHARRGLGRWLLEHSEAEAVAQGFSEFELMATLPGRRLYERYGYSAGEPIAYPLPDAPAITFVPMRKVSRTT